VFVLFRIESRVVYRLPDFPRGPSLILIEPYEKNLYSPLSIVQDIRLCLRAEDSVDSI